jgi:hypothetical protein
MTKSLGLAAIILLIAASPTLAGPCKGAIDEMQARVDAKIDNKAGAGPWKPESLDAKRSHQPTPGSIAATEGAAGRRYRHVLTLLKHARAADRAGNLDRCNAELGKARTALDAL